VKLNQLIAVATEQLIKYYGMCSLWFQDVSPLVLSLQWPRLNVAALLLCFLTVLEYNFKVCASELFTSRCSKSNPLDHGTHRLAIGFYGMSRNFNYTVHSFETNLFDVFGEHNITYDVYWSTAVKSTLSNAHSGEANVALDPFDARLVRPCIFSLFDHDTLLHDRWGKYLKKRNTTKHEESKMTIKKSGSAALHERLIQNLLVQMSTLENLNFLISEYSALHSFNYSSVMIIRPDTAIVTRMDNVAKMITKSELQKNTIYVPAAHNWWGVNDRFAFGFADTMSKAMQRFESFCNADKQFINSESFLLSYLRSQGIATKRLEIHQIRVRADGRVDPLDYAILSKDHPDVLKCIYKHGNQSVHYLSPSC
jgi:hypothetical protein